MLKALKIAMKYFLRERFTIEYPKELPPVKPNFMGIHYVYDDRCIGCGICTRVCPNRCVRLVEVEEKKRRPVIDYGRCMFCGLCTEYCPKNAIIHTPEFEVAVPRREDLVFGYKKLTRKVDIEAPAEEDDIR